MKNSITTTQRIPQRRDLTGRTQVAAKEKGCQYMHCVGFKRLQTHKWRKWKITTMTIVNV